MIIKLALISLFWTLVICEFHFYDEFVGQLFKILFRNDPRGIPEIPYVKPFCCEVCLTWWCGIAYLLLFGNISIEGLVAVLISAWFTKVWKFVIDSTNHLIILLYNILYGKEERK